MVNEVIVRIIVNRIITGGINPKTRQAYTLDDITNPEYKAVVEDYINGT